MLNTIIAILLGVLALYAAYAAVRASGRPRTGWLVLAIAAAVQVLNLVSGYSLLLAILSTIGLLVGFWLIRAPAHPGAGH